VDSAYAAAHGLRVGSTTQLGTTSFRVIGIVSQPPGGGSVGIYVPLALAQALALGPNTPNLVGEVSEIYVAASSAAEVPAVRAEIARLLPSATVTSADSLATAISGSLASAATLANDLGTWLAIAALLASFTIASLLTIGAVTRRVRELGTLKALGWQSRRIVWQLVGELAVVGAVGAAIGIAAGVAGVAIVNAAAPTLYASVQPSPGATPAVDVSVNSTGTHLHVAPGETVAVHLHARLTGGTVGLAVLLALAGALVAAAFAGWRATRLRPAQALAQVG
jgi:putative ABC transport system permease protein